MQQIKIFKSVETEIETLEAEINSWIAESGVKVVNLQGNIAPQTVAGASSSSVGLDTFSASDIMIIVTYEVEK